MMNLKQLREFFVFTHKERNGLLVLMFILILIIGLDISIPFLIPVKEYDVSKWKEETENYFAEKSRKEIPINKNHLNENLAESKFEGSIDPNNVDQGVLMKLGVPAGIAANWIKYLQKGGRFRKKEEVMKLYGMTIERYRKLEEFLVLPEKSEITQLEQDFSKIGIKKTIPGGRRDTLPNSHYPEKKKFQTVSLNAADSAQLEALPGIGPVLASRILKYRRLLGGYYDIAQLRDIYGMTDELWTKCSPWILADSTGIKKLEINFLSVSDLGRHPYIGFSHAKKMVKRRDVKGKYTDRGELSFCFSNDSLRRLLPYVSFGER